MTEFTMTAGELLEARLCSAPCLLALGTEANGCTCRCKSRWHGILTSVEVPGSVVPWYERHCYYGPAILDMMCPVISGGVKAHNRLYAQARHKRRVFAAVQRVGQGYELHVETETEAYGSRLSHDAADLFHSLLVALISAGRVRSGSGGCSVLLAYGVKTQIEAQTLGAIVLELHAGNHDGAKACLSALEEDGFVREAVTA